MHDCILIVDDELAILTYLRELLEGARYRVVTASSGGEALEALGRDPSMLVLCDVLMPEMDGFKLLEEVQRRHAGTDVMLMTGFASVDGAIEAMAKGAVDYIIKPLKAQEVLVKLRTHTQRRRLEVEVYDLQSELRSRFSFDRLIANSPAMRALLPALPRFAETDVPVVLVGEPGSGRDFIARALHFNGTRHEQPFRQVHCSSSPADQILAEMFGGDEAGQEGSLSEAHQGTLHLRSLDALPLASQADFAEQLSAQAVSADVDAWEARLIFSLDRPPEELLAVEALHPAFDFLRGFVSTTVPPLRQRAEDVPSLAQVFAAQHTAETGSHLVIPPESLELLVHQRFPGNVAQLFAILSHCATLSHAGVITPQVLSGTLKRISSGKHSDGRPMASYLEDRENMIVLQAVNRHRGQLEEAAKELGISRTTLWRRMRKYGISASGKEEGNSQPE